VRLGNRTPIVTGLAVILAGLLWGSTVAVDTPYLTIAGWLALIGIGMGMTMTPAMDAALGEVPVERSGSGSALTMALRQVGGALGVAVLGSVLSSVYTHRLDVTGLPARLAETAQESVAAGLGVARATGSTALAGSVTQAYVHAMSVVMLTSAGMAVLGMIVAGTLMPSRAAAQTPREESATLSV
jgi:hypothetical protein